MTANGKTEEQSTRAAVGRRGLIAGAAALAAAVIAKQATQPVQAADGLSLLIGNAAGSNTNNLYATTTTLSGSPGLGANPGFRVTNNVGTAGAPPAPGTAPTPDVSRDAIQGYASQANMPAPANASNAGVLGRNDDLNGIGAAGVGSNGTGIYGQSTSGTAVGASSTSGTGVYAISGSNYGVYGQSTSNIGGYFLSTGSYGVLGITTAGGPFSGLTGGATANGAAAFAGGTANPAAYAAYFTGSVVVDGSFTVVNPVNKHGAIKASDGTLRLLYSMESPEPWLEDFGKGTLSAGKAVVTFDPGFADVISGTDYHVFLTEYDDHNQLYVTKRTATGFTVQSKSGTGNSSFSWRTVATPKSDKKVQRLAKFTMPNITIPGITDNGKLPPANSPLPHRK